MKCIFWNCRGENKPQFRRSIRYLVKKFSTDILAVFETHAGGAAASRICRGLGFENSFRVDACGQSGGLWLLWRSEIGELEVVESSDQFIHAKIGSGTEVINVIAVYAAPTPSRRSGLWAALKEVINNVVGPVFIGGDFNTIVRLDERSGGNGRLSEDSLTFGDWINEMSLIDMGFSGSQFTWKRGKTESTFVAKRLDRVLCCATSRLKWQEARVSHLPFLASDHAPLYLQLTSGVQENACRRPFRYEAAWLQHREFQDLLKASWDCEIDTREALMRLGLKLRKWNKEVFGNVQKKKETLVMEIKGVQELIEQNPTDELLEKEGELLKEFERVLEQEELIWFQKSREKWVAHGERNTKFFHMSTIIRRRRNRVEALKKDDNHWATDANELEELAVNYFKRLYYLEDVETEPIRLSGRGFVRLTSQDYETLNKTFSAEEVEKAVRAMGSFKAPGLDGFQPVFYQRC